MVVSERYIHRTLVPPRILAYGVAPFTMTAYSKRGLNEWMLVAKTRGTDLYIDNLIMHYNGSEPS